MNKFEQVLDLVTELPLDQQKLLIEIVQRRAAQMRRQELVKETQEALAEFRNGNLKPLTAEAAILELQAYLDTPEIE